MSLPYHDHQKLPFLTSSRAVWFSSSLTRYCSMFRNSMSRFSTCFSASSASPNNAFA